MQFDPLRVYREYLVLVRSETEAKVKLQSAYLDHFESEAAWRHKGMKCNMDIDATFDDMARGLCAIRIARREHHASVRHLHDYRVLYQDYLEAMQDKIQQLDRDNHWPCVEADGSATQDESFWQVMSLDAGKVQCVASFGLRDGLALPLDDGWCVQLYDVELAQEKCHDLG